VRQMHRDIDAVIPDGNVSNRKMLAAMAPFWPTNVVSRPVVYHTSDVCLLLQCTLLIVQSDKLLNASSPNDTIHLRHAA
jgi:hypothetical protein